MQSHAPLGLAAVAESTVTAENVPKITNLAVIFFMIFMALHNPETIEITVA